MDKPIQIKIEECRQEIVENINKIANKYDIDYYFLAPILKDIYVQAEELRMQEYTSIKKQYEKEKTQENKEANPQK